MIEHSTIPSRPEIPRAPQFPRIPTTSPVGHGTGVEAGSIGDDPEVPDRPDDAGEIESSEIFRTLVRAIDGEQVVLVRFKGEPEPRRICPDRIGIDVHDQYQVEAFQLSGPSESMSGVQQWKCFHLHDLEFVGIQDTGWVDGPRTSTAGHCFHQVVYPVPGTQ
jgi:hypothetical protein